MAKGIRGAARAQELESASLSELIHQHVRVAIETAVHEELQAALASFLTSATNFDAVIATARRRVH